MKKTFVICLFVVLAFLSLACAKQDTAVEPETTPEPTATVTPTPEPTATPEPTPFTFLWISDTQKLAEKSSTNERYNQVGEWAASQIEEKNIIYMFGTGDYVQTFHREEQWERFEEFLGHFRGRIPWILIAGNHDIRLKTMEYEIGTDPLVPEENIPEQTYENGVGRYVLFNAGGIDWIVIGMSYGYKTDEIEWIDSVLEQYPDRKAILLFHDYMLFSKGFAKNARDFRKLSLVNRDNVRLILCGHNHGFKTLVEDPWEKGEHQLINIMLNKQETDSMIGSVAFITIDPMTGDLDLTYETPIGNGEPIEWHETIDLS